jgi:putative ABC transport system permease protein
MMPPLSASGFGGSFSIIGRTPEEASESMQVRPATPGYFEALRIPLRGGRPITTADREGAARVAVISEDAARKFWPGENPIGQRIRIHVGIYGTDTRREIVGVVGNVKTGSLAADARPVVYVPHAQYPSDVMTLFVRGSTADAMALLPAVKSQLSALDRHVALTSARPAAAIVSASVAAPRFRMLLLGVFAAIALALAAVGLYGVMAFSVTERQTELGLRIALGAEPGEVLRLVLFQGLIPVAVGIACGTAGAIGLTRLMSGLLFEVQPFDPLTFAAVAALLAVVAGVACYIPARRATVVDPMIAMRSE